MRRLALRSVILVWIAFFLSTVHAACAPVTMERAERVAGAWLRVASGTGRTLFGNRPHTISDGYGVCAYVVDLRPRGYAVIAGDDTLEPILVYSTQDSWNAVAEDVIGSLVRSDVRARLRSSRRAPSSFSRHAQLRWQRFDGSSKVVAFGTCRAAAAGGLEVLVPPLVTSRWNQGEYAPPYTYNSLIPDNLLTGCVATAMAAIVRYHRWPLSVAFSEYVNVRNDRQLLDCAFALNYDIMPDTLGFTSSSEKIAEVSKLILACGAAVQTSYGEGGSSAYTAAVADALRSRFGYVSAEWMPADSGDWRASLKSELQAGYPVQMDVMATDTYVRHSLICDGWANEDGVDRFHLNFGWGGVGDAWYAVPGFYANEANWDVFEGYVYKIRRPGVWEGLAMVSCPVEASDSDPKTAVGFTGDYWLCYDSGYARYPDERTWFESGQVPVGRGFWAYFSSKTAAPAGRSLDLAKEWPISLNPGWNMIGQPYVIPVDWDAARIMIERADGRRTALSGSADCAPYAWGWRSEPGTVAGGSYYLVGGSEFGDMATHRLVPWEAFWIRAYAPCRLVLPPPN